MPRPASFTVNNARFSKEEYNGVPVFRKEVAVNSKLQNFWLKLHEATLCYYHLLLKAGIPAPKIVETSANCEQLTFVCESRGQNVIEHLDSVSLKDVLEQGKILEQVLAIIKSAQKNSLYLDPHIKNFTIDDGHVWYVDFTPPWLPVYFDLRLSVATDHEKAILRPFFECMHPKVIGFHFVSDFIKMDKDNSQSLSLIFEKLAAMGLIKEDYDHFCREVERIKKTELAREREQVFII